MQADISYRDLYCKTAAVTASVAGTGYLCSLMCKDQSNVPLVQGIFGALALTAGAYYYNNWHPENRMYINQNNFRKTLNNPLLFFMLQGEAFGLQRLMSQLLNGYVERKNPLYDAVEDILELKRQSDAILKESRLLLRFYSICTKNNEYCTILERQIEEIRPVIETITVALVAIKNTPEYKQAQALQVEIEKQEALDRIARAEQTQAINSFASSTSHIVIATTN